MTADVSDDRHDDSAPECDEFEQQLRAALPDGNIPVLLMALVHLTGDTCWLDRPYHPTRPEGVDDNDDGGLPPEIQGEIREAVVQAVLAHRQGKPIAVTEPDEALTLRMLGVAMGEHIPDEYGPMLCADLATQPDEGHDIGVPAGFTATIVGAGISGLAAAVALKRAGIPFEVLEAADRIGGVWHENRYPGAGVDTPSHIYSYSFAPNEWSQYFALRAEIQEYLEKVAEDFQLTPSITFNATVASATWRPDRQQWELVVNAGETEVVRYTNVLVSAVGIFNPPKYPDVSGLDTFPGPVVHPARWPAGLDLTGRRVAIVGNGASAMQIVPAVVDTVESITIFQRSTHWIMPFEKFHKVVPDSVRWLFRHVPYYQAWYRLRVAWTFNDKVHPSLQKDPDWPHPERSVSRHSDRYRRFLTRYAEEQLGDRTDLLAKVLPDYPPYVKRMLLDNGWFAALRRPNTHLVTDPISHVDRDAVVTPAGDRHEADVLILATGFDVAHFLTAFEIRGHSGRPLRERGDDVQAYLGTVIPDLPNFFVMYGPNTQPGHGGSIMFTIETQTHYMVSVLEQMFAAGKVAAAPRQEVCDAFNAEVDRRHENMVWTHPGVATYYRNSRGRVVVNSPYRNVDWFDMTRRADLDEFVTEPPRDAVAEAGTS